MSSIFSKLKFLKFPKILLFYIHILVCFPLQICTWRLINLVMEADKMYDILAESGCEIHSIKDTPGGDKRYEKASKEQLVDTANHVNEVAQVQEFLKDKTFEERYEWVEQSKNEANQYYADKLYGKALDKYLNALYGLNFPDQTIENERKVNFELKVPLLNNMSICLLKVKQYQKVIAMTDQVLLIDPDNFKALIRRASAHLELGNFSEAKETLTKAKRLAKSKEDGKTIAEIKQNYEKCMKKQEEFAQKVFSKSENTKDLYKDKPIPSASRVDPLVDQDEVEYLKTIGNIHWFLYPYIKTFRALINCRRRPIPFREELGLDKLKED